jgi:hypothetical protein
MPRRSASEPRRNAGGSPYDDGPPPDPSPCIGQCISVHRAYGTNSPDSVVGMCASCEGCVCCECGEKPVEDVYDFCAGCQAAIGRRLAERDDWGDDYLPPFVLRGELNALAAQIVNSGGPDYPRTHATLNRQMGVQQRDEATLEQLHDGAEYARAWLAQLRRPDRA